MCVNFMHEWQDLQMKVDSERQTFEKLFMAILLMMFSFLPKNVHFILKMCILF